MISSLAGGRGGGGGGSVVEYFMAMKCDSRTRAIENCFSVAYSQTYKRPRI